jgi:hypothetical protein
LDGEFVYSWDGKDLVLLPVSSPDYIACKAYTDLQDVKFNSRQDLHEGFLYLTNKQEELVYLGRHEVCTDSWHNKVPFEIEERYRVSTKIFQKRHVFAKITENGVGYEFLNGFSRIKQKISDDCHSDFANLVDKFLKSEFMGRPDHLMVAPLTKGALANLKQGWGYNYVYQLGKITSARDIETSKKRVKFHSEDDSYEVYIERPNNTYGWGRTHTTDISEGRFSGEELKQNYGKLTRVYKNGFKKEV